MRRYVYLRWKLKIPLHFTNKSAVKLLGFEFEGSTFFMCMRAASCEMKVRRQLAVVDKVFGVNREPAMNEWRFFFEYKISLQLYSEWLCRR